MSRSEANHAPTPQRLQQARREGKTATGRDLVWAGIWISCVCGVAWSGPIVVDRWRQLVQVQWDAQRVAQGSLLDYDSVSGIAVAVLPLLLLILGGAILFNLVQGGWGFFPGKARPQWSRLSREERAPGVHSFLRAATTGMKLASLFSVTGLFLYWRRNDLMSLGANDLQLTWEAGSGLIMAFAFQVTIVLGCFGLIDYGLSKMELLQSLKMTDEELRDEQQQRERDGRIHAARSVTAREQHSQPAWPRSNDADLLIVDGRATAIGVSWNDDSCLSGTIKWIESGSRALVAIADAANRNLEVRRDPALAGNLAKLQVGNSFDSTAPSTR